MAENNQAGQVNAAQDSGDTAPQIGVQAAPPAGERTFTQAQVDAFVAERSKHAKSAALGDLLKDLGFTKAEELKTAVEAQRTAQQASLTETERLKAQVAEHEKERETWAAQRREQALQIAVQQAATRLGIVDPEAALLLVRAKIEFDGNGTPQGVDAALTELLAAKPYLRAGQGVGTTNPPRGAGGSALTREDIAKMGPEEINRRWDEVSAALAKG